MLQLTSPRRIFLCFFAMAMCLAAPWSHAQDFPKAQSVKIIVPFAAGSASDTVGRIMADELQKTMGGSFIVENKPGAVGMIGTEQGARSAPDGYTLILTSNSTHALAPYLYKKVPYDPVKDFVHLGQWISVPFVLVVKPDFPAKTVAEFVDYAKNNPGKLAYGYGTPSSQLGAQLLDSMAGIQTLGVSYKSHPGAVTDLIAGQTQYMVLDLSTALAQINGGRLRAIAVTSSKRIPFLPNVPSVSEVYPDYEYSTWIGLAAPAGTPKPVVERISQASQKILSSPEVQQRFASQFIAVDAKPYPEQEAYVKANLEVWKKRFAEWKIAPQ